MLKIQILDINKVAKIIVISKNKNHLFTIIQIILRELKCFENGYEFIVVDFILYLFQNHFPFKKMLQNIISFNRPK